MPKVSWTLQRFRKVCPSCKKWKMIQRNKICCSQSCAGRYKWAKKEFREKQEAFRSSPSYREKMRRHTTAMHKRHPEYAKASSALMARANPMTMPGVKARVTRTRLANGTLHLGPPQRGGNGKGPTRAERALAAALPKYWRSQFIVCTKREAPWPHHYKLDMAHPAKKIDVEADGGSHYGRKAIDRRRDECLRALGWQVLRFPNRQILSDLDLVLQTIKAVCESTISK
jgi:very-short-patch-repair endonuclease